MSDALDYYGKEAVSLNPLRLLEGRSTFPDPETKFLRLPIEVLALILMKLTPDALSKLALVNSECRQMARSLQFASLCLDFSLRSLVILERFHQEFMQHEEPDIGRRVGRLSLGPYVRRLVVATSTRSMLHRMYAVESETLFQATAPGVQMSARLEQAAWAYYCSYLPMIERLLNTQGMLPQLQLLDIRDAAAILPSFVDAITKSTIQHLRLCCNGFYLIREIIPGTLYPPGSWPLQSLHLELEHYIPRRGRQDISKICLSLLLHCSSHLKMFSWIGRAAGQKAISASHLTQIPAFPSLRHLRLHELSLWGTGLLQKLVTDDLISVDIDPFKVDSDFFGSRSRIRKLQLCICNTGTSGMIFGIPFLRNNNHVSKLAIFQPLSAAVLEKDLLPLLARRFKQLKSLSLTLEEEQPAYEEEMERDTSRYTLHLISHITSLVQLHLSVGPPEGSRLTWEIDGDKMRQYLRKLPLLKILAFSNDVYPQPESEEEDITEDVLEEMLAFTNAVFPQPESEEGDITEDEEEEIPADEEQENAEDEEEHEPEDEEEPIPEEEAEENPDEAEDDSVVRVRDEAKRYWDAMPQLSYLHIGLTKRWRLPKPRAGDPKDQHEPEEAYEQVTAVEHWREMETRFGWRDMSVWHTAESSL
ncbi:MAG: hypothetical protein Q9168_007397 [Polycauliona sp. 1 TL-2023]